MPLQKQHFQKTKTVLYASDEGKRFGRYDRRRTEHCGRGAAGSGNPAVSKKYVVLGAVLFAFIYAAVLCMGYIFNSRIRVNDGLQDLYGIPQIGVVVKDSKKSCSWIDGLTVYDITASANLLQSSPWSWCSQR